MTVKVKICGLTNSADVQAAVASGADMLGFIFHPKSPRYIPPIDVCRILELLGDVRRSVTTVGVFVNEPRERVAHVLELCGLDAAQLHGEEPPSMLGLEGGTPEETGLFGSAYKALRPCSRADALTNVERYALAENGRSGGRLPAFLLDAYHPDLRGGTGLTGDWQLAAELTGRFPLLLAGGLNPENVSEAVAMVNPWGVDAASGIEASPGRKDHAALEDFVRAVKGGPV
jgi:phosphoribosylanthranilate isomerase